MQFLAIALMLTAGAAGPRIYSEGLSVAASSETGGTYASAMAVDGMPATRWASADKTPMPQWFELRFAEPVELDTVLLHIAVDSFTRRGRTSRSPFPTGRLSCWPWRQTSRIPSSGSNPVQREPCG